MQCRIIAAAAIAATLLACRPGANVAPTVGPTAAQTATLDVLAAPSTTPGVSPSPPSAGAPLQTVVPGQQVFLHIAADADPVMGDDCDRLLPLTITSASPDAPGRIVACTVADDFHPARYHFLRDFDGSLYLEAVELLLLTKGPITARLPVPDCKEVPAVLAPAEEAPAAMKNVLACLQSPPLPTGVAGGEHLAWAPVAADAPENTALDLNYCWKLMRYVDSQPTSTRAVKCILDRLAR